MFIWKWESECVLPESGSVHASSYCCIAEMCQSKISPCGMIKVFFNWIELNIYDLVPKGVQEKRTEVLENKVDRMWVSNAFF